MADMMDTLKGLLGDNADEKINNVMNMLKSEDTAHSDSSGDGAAVTPELLSQAQGLLQQISSAGNDDRSRLLMSLKPYMRKNRQDTIDNAVKLLNVAQLSQLFKL